MEMEMEMEMDNLHPLLTEQNGILHNTQYLKKDRNDIQNIEDELTVSQMIGFCLGNIMKYSSRIKGQDEADNHKINKYCDYRDELRTLERVGLGSCTVTKAWKYRNKKWRYS